MPVDASRRPRSEYSYDASNYGVEAVAVAFPCSVEDVSAAVAMCRASGTAVVAEGVERNLTREMAVL